MQREQQDKVMDEMFSPISGLTLPASIEERLEFYQHRMHLEDKGINYKIVKQKFLNYRQFSSKLTKGKSESIPSYTLSYSTLARKKAQGRIEFEHNSLHYLNRDEIIITTLKHFNSVASTAYKDIYELIYNPQTYEQELEIRSSILDQEHASVLDLSPIVIVEDIPNGKLTLNLDAKIYEDTKEKLILC